MECAALVTASHLPAKTAAAQVFGLQPDTSSPHFSEYTTRRCIFDGLISDGTVGLDSDPCAVSRGIAIAHACYMSVALMSSKNKPCAWCVASTDKSPLRLSIPGLHACTLLTVLPTTSIRVQAFVRTYILVALRGAVVEFGPGHFNPAHRYDLILARHFDPQVLTLHRRIASDLRDPPSVFGRCRLVLDIFLGKYRSCEMRDARAPPGTQELPPCTRADNRHQVLHDTNTHARAHPRDIHFIDPSKRIEGWRTAAHKRLGAVTSALSLARIRKPSRQLVRSSERPYTFTLVTLRAFPKSSTQ